MSFKAQRKPSEGTPFLEALDALKRKGDARALWMLIGDDSFMVTRLARALQEAVVPRHRDFNFPVIDCKSGTGAGSCITLCEELPIMAEQRLLWLRDVHALPDEQRSRLAAYLPEMPPTTVLLLTGSGKAEARADGEAAADEEEKRDPVAGMKALRKAAKERGVLVNGKVEPADLAQWIAAEFKRRGLEAGVDVRRRFLNDVGLDLATLETEMEKLACFVGARRKVEERDLDAITTPSPTTQTFHFSNAVAEGKVAAALNHLAILVEADMHPLQILAYLGSHFRGLIKVCALLERGATAGEMGRLMGKGDWGLERDIKTARNFTAAGLERVLEAMLRADRSMKRGKDPRLVLELLTIHLCRAAR